MGNEIINKVTYIITNTLDKCGFEKARKELMRLYLKHYENLKSIEDKRQIIGYLMYVESELHMLDMVKIHSEELKQDMDKIVGYAEDYPEYYMRMMKFYNMSHTTNEQKINNKYTKEKQIKIIC